MVPEAAAGCGIRLERLSAAIGRAEGRAEKQGVGGDAKQHCCEPFMVKKKSCNRLDPDLPFRLSLQKIFVRPVLNTPV